MTWRVNSWLIGELVIIKIPIDFLNNLIMITKIFSYMKGGDNSKKDKEIKRKKMEHRLRYNPTFSCEKAGY